MANRKDEDETISTPVVRPTPQPVGRGEGCLVVIYGPDLGRRLGLGHRVFEVGRSSKCDLSLDQESVSRHHARITRGKKRGDTPVEYSIMDLGSTNGTYVNDRPITERTLKDGDQIKIGRSILKFMSGDNIETSYHEEIYRLMTIDGLTELFNKRYFNEELERELQRATRYERPLSLLLFDIDHFKSINDKFGHVAGDAFLKQLAQAVKEKLRAQDVLARVGGEEFAVLLPEVDPVGAKTTADKIRAVVESTVFSFDGEKMPATISIGVATNGPKLASPLSLYGAADAALYSAKATGRNRVVVSG
ncbi:MAG TPA: GGDEF domain-containing protein [Polyangiaceae bacterium]